MQIDPALVHSHRESSDTRLARSMLHRLCGKAAPALNIRLWNGDVLNLGRGGMPIGLFLRHPDALSDALRGGGFTSLADAYVRGDVDILGDIHAVLGLPQALGVAKLSWKDKLALYLDAWQLRKRHLPFTLAVKALGESGASPTSEAASAWRGGAAAFPHEAPNAFFRLWLDRQLGHAGGVFNSEDDSLEDAQTAKLEAVCRKLALKPGDRFLDVACGWGALLVHAARHHGVMAEGVTHSHRQYELVRQRIEDAGLRSRVSVRLLDQHDAPLAEASYDKIASVAMFEHTGALQRPHTLRALQRLLAPDGLLVTQALTQEDPKVDNTLPLRLLSRQSTPEKRCESMADMVGGMASLGLEIRDMESQRAHCALTFRHWVRRLEARHEEAVRHVGEQGWRAWRLHMAASAMHFEQGSLGAQLLVLSQQAPLNKTPRW